MFDRDHRADYKSVTGTERMQAEVTLSIAAVSRSRLFGEQKVQVGELCPGKPLSPQGELDWAHARSLEVTKDGHACAISHRCLYAAKTQRLVVSWSIATSVERIPIALPAEEQLEMRERFGQPKHSIYAVPLLLTPVTPLTTIETAFPWTAAAVTLKVDVRPQGTYTYATVSPPQGPPLAVKDFNLDTGAFYTAISARFANTLGLVPPYKKLKELENQRIILPRIDFPSAQAPILTVLNMPAYINIDNSFPDDIILGSSLFDRFTHMLFDRWFFT